MGEIYPDQKFFIREAIKGKKKTTVYAIKNPEERGITVQTVVESLDEESEPKISEKKYENESITHCKINGKIIYELTGGL